MDRITYLVLWREVWPRPFELAASPAAISFCNIFRECYFPHSGRSIQHLALKDTSNPAQTAVVRPSCCKTEPLQVSPKIRAEQFVRFYHLPRHFVRLAIFPGLLFTLCLQAREPLYSSTTTGLAWDCLSTEPLCSASFESYFLNLAL
jgi:hypothetical protein